MPIVGERVNKPERGVLLAPPWATGGTQYRPRAVLPLLRGQQLLGNHAVQRLLSGGRGHCGVASYPMKLQRNRRISDGLPISVPVAGHGDRAGVGVAATKPRGASRRFSRCVTLPGRTVRGAPGFGGSGRPLEAALRREMESRFGSDFSGVRLHTDADANALTWVANTRALTIGQHIFFGSGEYAPRASDGRRLLIHELTHVVQQDAATGTKLVTGRPGDAYEREADHVARVVSASATSLGSDGLRVSRRCPELRVQGESGVEHGEGRFGYIFAYCMEGMGMPVPSTLFDTAGRALATLGVIAGAVEKFGTAVTIGELVGAGVLTEKVLAAGSVLASAYVGAATGCVLAASTDWLDNLIFG